MKNRNGSYKKILLEESLLRANGEYLRSNVQALKALNLSSFDLTTLYMLLFLRIKHPKNWLQQKSYERETNSQGLPLLSLIPESMHLNSWEKEKLKDITTFELFSLFNLKGIPQSINRTMMNWHLGLWKIEMLEHIPTSKELLKMQVKNTRCISLITDPQKIDQLVFGTRDPLSFVLHDLMHADQFFNKNESQKGQLGFYNLIHQIYDKPETKTLLKTNSEFKQEFEYVASDMNAYVIHLFKCLKSSIYRTQLHEHYFQLITKWWQMNEDEIKSSNNLNTPQFSDKDEFILKKFFENNQEIYP